MIEKTLLDYLKSVSRIPVFLEKKSTSPEEFYLLERTGGYMSDRIHHATFAIQSYGKTLFRACELNQELKILMERFIELPSIGACQLNSDYNYTDTTMKKYRYQAVFEIIYYDD